MLCQVWVLACSCVVSVLAFDYFVRCVCVCVLLLACSFVASVLGFESSVSSVSFYLLAHPSVVSDYICGSSVCCLSFDF